MKLCSKGLATLLRSLLICVTIVLFGAASARAEPRDSTEALALIKDFAHEVCHVVPASGSYSEWYASADGRAAVDGFAKKLATVSLGAGGGRKEQEYAGLLQPDLLRAVLAEGECRQALAQHLVDVLLSSPKKTIKRAPTAATSSRARVTTGQLTVGLGEIVELTERGLNSVHVVALTGRDGQNGCGLDLGDDIEILDPSNVQGRLARLNLHERVAIRVRGVRASITVSGNQGRCALHVQAE